MKNHSSDTGTTSAGPGAGPRAGRWPFRAYALGMAVLLVVAWTVVGFGLATVQSLYPGTGAAFPAAKERPAIGHVGECRRAGPVSVNGFGYWWECRVLIRTDDGREVRTVLRHSIVAPSDAGRDVDLRETCSGDDNTDCRYGRPADRTWGVAMAFLNLLVWAVNIAFVFLVGLYLLGAVLGERRYDALMAKVGRRDRRTT
jgi:hypothetical protein